MSIRNKLLGLRWSLYIVRDGKEIVYAMHSPSVMRIVGYVMLSFAEGGKPVPPWSLYLHFNKKRKGFTLRPEHFTPDGNDVTDLLVQMIMAIDPKWSNHPSPDGEAMFEEFATKRQIKVLDSRGFEEMFDDYGKPEEPTFFSILEQVFGKI